jgi:hypothetical protein
MRTKSLVLVVFASLALLAGGTFAQSFSVSPNPDPGQILPPGGGTGGPCGPITLTQSVTQNIAAGNSVSCNAGGLHTDNSYYRAFDLSADFGIADNFNVCGGDFAIEQIGKLHGDDPVRVGAGPFLDAPIVPGTHGGERDLRILRQ